MEAISKSFHDFEVNLILDDQSYDKKGAAFIIRQMSMRDYISYNNMDDSRIDDKRAVVEYFQKENDLSNDEIKTLLLETPSVFDILVAIAYRIDTTIMTEEYSVAYWFWKMIDNIGLGEIAMDEDDTNSMTVVEDAIDKLCYTKYGKEGFLFPIKSPDKDMRKVGLWNQAQAWLGENYLE